MDEEGLSYSRALSPQIHGCEVPVKPEMGCLRETKRVNVPTCLRETSCANDCSKPKPCKRDTSIVIGTKTTADIVAALVKAGLLTSSQAPKAVTAVFDTMRGFLGQGDEVCIENFGTFTVHRVKGSCRTDRCGDHITRAGYTHVTFRDATKLKQAVKTEWFPVANECECK
jgi:nucleoid DNA-binding protein